MLKRAIVRYELINASHPITVRGGVGIGLFFVGDVLAQRAQWVAPAPPPARQPAVNLAAVLVEKKAGSTLPPENPPLPLPPEMQMVPSFGYEQWDPKRSARACSWRALIWAPVAHYFWLGLETYVSPMVAHLGHRGTAIKVVLDFW